MLSDLTIISLGQAVCAPFAASRLADMGARVIKIERPGGDFARKYDRVLNGESVTFAWLNRGKESIELDLREPEDRIIFLNMIRQADVFLQNLSPGALDRLGLGEDVLRDCNPALIHCNITGYGTDGPYADAKAYDMLIQAESGLASVTGSHAEAGRVGISVVDIATGMYAINGIMTALYNRHRTGKGSRLDISMFDVMADWMAMPLLSYKKTGVSPDKHGFHHPTIAPYGLYQCKGGGEIVIAIQNDREWADFCTIILGDIELCRDPRFVNNPDRLDNRKMMDNIIKARLEQLNENELVDLLLEAKIAHGRVNDMKGLAQHPQLHMSEIIAFHAPLEMPRPPVAFNGEYPLARNVPCLSEHAGALRKEYSD